MTRVLKIIEILESRDYVTSEDLALKIGVSIKTIRNDIKSLSESQTKNGFSISSKPRFGYRLLIQNDKQFNQFKMQNNYTGIPTSIEDRIAFVAVELLQSNKFQSIEKISDKVYVSKSTMHNIIKKIDELFISYSLVIERKTNFGIRVIGNEEDIRQCLYDLMARYELFKYFHHLKNDYIIEKISEELMKLLKEFDITLSEVAFYNFLTYLFIDLNRIKKGNSLTAIRTHNTNYIHEKEMIDKLALFIKKETSIDFNQFEKQSLIYKLMGVRSSNDYNSEIYVTEDTHQIANEMIKSVDREFNLEFGKDFELKMNLIRHLIPMIIRIQFGITSYNVLLETIKDKYSFAYLIASHSCLLLENRFNRKVSEDEISYLALIYSLSLEKEKKENKVKKNIILVCGSSVGSAHLLKYKYQSEFGDYLNNISICSLSELNTMNLDNIDYIFTTVPVIKKMMVPIIQVGYFLDDEDIYKVKKVFNKTKVNILKDYFQEDQFSSDFEFKTREDALLAIFDFAKNKYSLTNEFYESMVTRELLAKTAFGNLVAMPHTVESISSDTFVYLFVLKKPIMWGDQKVQVLFLINVGKLRGETLVKFYDLTMRFIMEKELVDSLIKKPTFSNFIEIINNLDQMK